MDLSGKVINTGSTSLSLAANSLLILPSASSTSSYASYSNAGLTDILGTTLNVSAGTGFGGWGTVPNRVSCSGSITATPGGWINLGNGLALAGTGQVNLGSGTLTVNDTTFSSMTAGALTANTMVIGQGGTGSFTQSGGSDTIGQALVLARNSGDNGTYNLNGGLLRVSNMSAGSGSALLNDGGGTLQAAASFSGNVPIALAAGSRPVFDTGGNTLTLTAAVSGSGGLTKTGTGLLVLSGTDTYSGGTTVLNGKLSITSPAALRDGSSLTVGAAATTKFTSIIPDRQTASDAQAVPEPGTLALIICGVCTAVACHRRPTRRQLNLNPNRER